MKGLCLVLLFWGIGYCAMAQGFENKDVDTNDVAIKKAVSVLRKYYKSYSENGYDTSLWHPVERKRYVAPDLIDKELQPSIYMAFPKVIYAGYRHEDTVLLKTIWSYSEDGKTPEVFSIVSHYLVREGKDYKLVNALSINRLVCSYLKIGLVDYYCLKTQKIDKKEAVKTSEFVAKFCRDWGIKPKHLDYYFAETLDEVYRLRGIDFLYGNGRKEYPAGKAHPKNRIAYSSGMNAGYVHEVVHVLVNELYPKVPLVLQEGLATFYGGSRGKSYKVHGKRLNKWLDSQVDSVRNNPLMWAQVDNETNGKYVVGALICEAVFKKSGVAGLKRMFKEVDSKEKLIVFLEKELGIKEKDFGVWVKERL